MKLINYLIISLFSISVGASEFPYLDSMVYSSLGLKCTSADVTLYFGASGELSKSGSNKIKTKVFSKNFDTNFLKDGIESSSRLFGKGDFNTSFTDAFNFKYEFSTNYEAFFQDGISTRALLTRRHPHDSVDVEEEYELDCVTSVKSKSVKIKLMTKKIFKTLSDEQRSALMGEVVPSGRHDLDDLELDGQSDYLIYKAYAKSMKAVAYDSKAFAKLPKAIRAYGEKVNKLEDETQESCIADWLGYSNLIDDEQVEVLDNWSICSYELFLVFDHKSKLLGAVSAQYNDNGYDDYDGHNGGDSFYDDKGQHFGHYEWSN